MDPRILLEHRKVFDRAWRGLIAEDAVDFLDPIEVVIPDFNESLTWGPCIWMPRDDIVLPVRGDPCLVLFDNTRSPWIVAWRPQS